jgi:hypothetical protein
LPHVQLGQVLPVVRNYWRRLYATDAALLKAMPSLKHLAGIRVIELTK